MVSDNIGPIRLVEVHEAIMDQSKQTKMFSTMAIMIIPNSEHLKFKPAQAKNQHGGVDHSHIFSSNIYNLKNR